MDSKHRLKKREEYDWVLDKGISCAARLAVLKIKANSLGISRYGIITSKKVGGAVQRNKVKRRLREILRGVEVVPGWDIVVIARSGARGTGFDELKMAVTGLLSRGRVMQKDEKSDAGAD